MVQLFDASFGTKHQVLGKHCMLYDAGKLSCRLVGQPLLAHQVALGQWPPKGMAHIETCASHLAAWTLPLPVAPSPSKGNGPTAIILIIQCGMRNMECTQYGMHTTSPGPWLHPWSFLVLLFGIGNPNSYSIAGKFDIQTPSNMAMFLSTGC